MVALVTPLRPASSSAASTPRRSSAASVSGMTLPMSSSALSLKMPVGSPRASRTISPPSGSGVAAVIPASRIARELAQPVCPSTRPR